ncbi:hypothetical protein CSUB01_06556 [Colletotrichum sublineola]|uniref:C6 zinc finger domain-containing protein n=1 Tax=Colletotrichum sublineola TaxID=1173701 RepID=A0A066X0Z7_COLSU|nr:hypothetical protein CSUB01_06556 [Colletotrichum sublineola]
MSMVRRAATVAAHASSRDALHASLPAERLRADEAELKHHFLNQAWFTFSLQKDPRKCDVWSRWVPQLATRNIFIHQSMLSIAALHLCYLEPPDAKRYYSMACRHAIQASNYFRLAVPQVNDENWLATFVFSMCNGIFGYYRPFADEKIMGQVSTFEPAKSFAVMRVAARFSDQVTRYVYKSPNRNKLAQVDPDEWRESNNILLRPSLLKVAKLEEFLLLGSEVTGVRAEDTEVYRAALSALRTYLISLPGRPRIWKHFIIWPSLVSEQYISLLQMKKPVALMLFAIWAKVMYLAPQRWYLMAWYGRNYTSSLRELARQVTTPAHRFWETLVDDSSQFENCTEELEASGGCLSTPSDIRSDDGVRKSDFLLMSTGEEFGPNKDRGPVKFFEAQGMVQGAR